MPLFPFNILAPITLGRRGLQGEPGNTPTSIALGSVTGKPATFTPATHTHSALVRSTPPNGENETKASGILTVASGPSAGQTITIEGVVLTFANALSASLITDIPLVLFGTTSQAATAIANTINNNYRRLSMMAVASSNVVTLYSVMDGLYGNASTISSSSAAVTASGATLAGGSFSTATATSSDYVGQQCIVANHVFICTALTPTIIWKRI